MQRRAQRFALAGAVLAAAVSATVTIQAMRIEASGEQSVERVMEARRQIADLGANVAGAGSGIRAYLLAKAPADLNHYHASVLTVPKQLSGLAELMAGNPVQQSNLERLRPLISERFDRLAMTLQGAEQTASVLEATQLVLSRIQAVVDDMDTEEQRSLELHRAQVRSAGKVAKVVSTLGLLLSLGLVLLGWSLQRLELKREIQLTEALTRSQEQLQRLSDELARSNKDLDAFAGRIAHDLKNTLTPAGAAAGILRRVAKRADGLQATLTEIGDSLGRVSARADRMIDSLLAFSRLETLTQTDSVAHTNVGPALKDLVEGLALQIAAVDATVQLEVEDSLVRCPPGLFNIVALNLIGNAIKFLQGMPRRRVLVTTRQEAGWLILKVEDTGPGIPEGDLSRIFAPFYRVRGTNAAGTGIGLATVERIVRAHGGRVEVRSRLGDGATFEARFPLAASGHEGAARI